MVYAERLLQDPFLSKGIEEGISNPGCYVIEPFSTVADGDQSEAAETAPGKNRRMAPTNTIVKTI